jgi:DNA mismatch repair protein MutS
MALDAATRRNLELVETLRTGEVQGSLLGVLDRTVTPMGKRLLRHWIANPLLDIERIRNRHNQVEVLYDEGLWRAEVRQILKPLGDLERLTNRIAAGVARPRDLTGLREILEWLPSVVTLLDGRREGPMEKLAADIDPCPEVLELLKRAMTDEPPATLAHSGVIRAGFSEELDEVVAASRGAREWIAELESIERQRTGINNLKVGYNKVFGYCAYG